MKLTAIIEKGEKFWIGRIAELSGVLSQGKTKSELIDNLRDAAELMIKSNKKDALKFFSKKDFESKKIIISG